MANGKKRNFGGLPFMVPRSRSEMCVYAYDAKLSGKKPGIMKRMTRHRL
jgi:hypothetical protein